MSSGKPRRRKGTSRRGQQTNPARSAQHSTPSQPPGGPPATGPSAARSPLAVWGAAILGALAIAFIVIFLIAPTYINPEPLPTPTPGIAPASSLTPSATIPAGASGGRIAFVRSVNNGIRNLFVVNADGTNQQQVTDGLDINGVPAWSPDGNSVLIQTAIEGVTTIARVTVGPDNKMVDSAQLTADIKADSVAAVWSPDGTMIAFQSKRDGPLSQVFVMNADGSDKRRLSDGNGFAGQPSWSPDGKMVVYVAGEQQTAGAPREVYTVNVDENAPAPTRITNVGGSLTNPIWSPDGVSIVCVQPVSDRDYKLLMMNSDGSDLRTLDEGHAIRAPSFSPTGDAIAYYSVSNVGNNITIYHIETGRVDNITDNQGDNYFPVWSPDGSMLAWAGAPPGTPEHKIVAANRDGSGRITVSSGDGEDSQPDWGVVEK